MKNDITLSLFQSSKHTIPDIVTVPWDAFSHGLGPHQFDRPSKDVLPAFSPAVYDLGATRKIQNVRRVSFGVLDFDKISIGQYDNVLNIASNYDALVYSTWSHPKYVQQGLWCVRVCIRLNRPVMIAEWYDFQNKLFDTFGNLSDHASRSPTSIFYRPFAPKGTEEHAIYRVFKGQAFEVV